MSDDDAAPDDLTLQLVAERAVVSKQTVETALVQVSTRVEEHQELISQALRRDEVVIKRIPVNRIVEAAPDVRHEGDVVIYPILEETLVVEKRLLLKEEVHVIRTSRLETVEQEVTLRAMHADVQRTPTPRPIPQD